MSTSELKKRLIDKIKETDNNNLLEEAFRLLQLESEDIEAYKLSEDQKNAVNEARQQIKNGQFLTDDEANRLYGFVSFHMTLFGSLIYNCSPLFS